MFLTSYHIALIKNSNIKYLGDALSFRREELFGLARSGVVRVPCGLSPGAKNIFAPPSTKLQSLRLKNRRKSKCKTSAEFTFVPYFSESNKTRLALKAHLTKCSKNLAGVTTPAGFRGRAPSRQRPTGVRVNSFFPKNTHF